jgi:hypothetical protein
VSAWAYAWGRAWGGAWGAIVAAVTLPAPEHIARPAVEVRRTAITQARTTSQLETRVLRAPPASRQAQAAPARRAVVLAAATRTHGAAPHSRYVAARAEQRLYRLTGPRMAAPHAQRITTTTTDRRTAPAGATA